MSSGSACMVVLAWCGRVWAVVADWAAGFPVLRYGGGGGRWRWRCCWCAPGVLAWGGAVWLDPGFGWGVAPCWRARWRAP